MEAVDKIEILAIFLSAAAAAAQRYRGGSAARRLHLRKTARGASSPAKPALHIPELQRDNHQL
jgi:hypothetical protein